MNETEKKETEKKDWTKNVEIILRICTIISFILSLIGFFHQAQIIITSSTFLLIALSAFIISLIFLIITIFLSKKKRNIRFFSDRNKVPIEFTNNNILENLSKRRLNMKSIGRTNISWFKDIEIKKGLYKNALTNGCNIIFVIQHDFVKNANMKDKDKAKSILGEREKTIEKFKELHKYYKDSGILVDDAFKLLLTSVAVDNSITALYNNNNYYYHFSYDIGLNIEKNPYLVFLNNSVIPELKDKFHEGEKNCIDIFEYEKRCNKAKNKIDKLIDRYSQFSGQRENHNKKLVYHYFERKKKLENKEFYPPVSIQLLITNNCTTTCIMCGHHSINTVNKELSTSQIYTIIDNIHDIDTKNIIISGGEPLYRNDCFEILKYAKDKDLNVGLLTNGIKIDKTSKKKCAITPSDALRIKYSCDWVQLSIDSFDPDTYKKIRNTEFDIVKESIANLEEAEVNLEIAFTIQDSNINEAIEIVRNGMTNIEIKTKIRFKFAHGPNNEHQFLLTNKKNELIEFISECENNTNFNTEYIKEMFRGNFFNTEDIINGEPLLSKNKAFKDKGYLCHAINYSCKIDAEGDIYPCCFLYDDNVGKDSDIRQRHKAGSLRTNNIIQNKDALKSILSDRFEQFRNDIIPLHEKACNYCTRHFYQNAFLNELDKIVKDHDDIHFIYPNNQEESDNSKMWI